MVTQIQTTKFDLDLEKDQNVVAILNRDYVIEQHIYPSKKYFKIKIKF
jgi:hypothetical protein